MRTATAVTAALLAFAGCSDGDGDSDKSDDKPDLSEPTVTEATDADQADEQDVKAAIRAYDKALVSFNRERGLTPDFEAVTTESWADTLLQNFDDNIFSNGLEMVGRWRTIVRSVSVAGDTADANVCSDGNKVYVVEQGGGIPNGAQSQGRSAGAISLVREDDGWQVDGNVTGEGKC